MNTTIAALSDTVFMPKHKMGCRWRPECFLLEALSRISRGSLWVDCFKEDLLRKMVLNTRASPNGMPIFWLASIGCYFPNWMRPAFAAAASSLETPSRLQIQTQTEFDKRGQLAPVDGYTVHYIDTWYQYPSCWSCHKNILSFLLYY